MAEPGRASVVATFVHVVELLCIVTRARDGRL